MNEQMIRLYAAAKTLKGIEGASAIAKLLNISPQTLNNWEDRGISQDGLLRAQEVIGCDAIWLRDASRPMTPGSADLEIDEMIELMALYQQSNARGRTSIVAFARAAAKNGAVRWARNVNDKS